jgi:predicted P-loop ATPase
VKFLAPNPAGVPQALRLYAHWVEWSAEPGKNGKDSKEPYQVGKKWRASTTKADTWATFDAAVAAMSNGIPRDGIGYVFHKGDDQTFTDFDHVRNPATGEIAPWASAIITAMNSYSEVSPTGTGVHVYSLGSFQGKGLKVKFSDDSGMEMYCRARYATVTGHPLPDSPIDLQPADAQAFYDRLKHGQIRPDVQAKAEDTEPPIEPRPINPETGVRELLTKFGLTIKSVEDPYQGETEIGIKYVLESCPNYETHKDAAVFDYPSGPVFHCFHDSCADKTWRHVCSLYEYAAPDISSLAWRGQLIVGENGKPKALLQNAILMLRHAPEWAGVLAYNEFSLFVTTLKPAPWPQSIIGKNWTDDDDTRTTGWLQTNGIFVTSKVASEAAQSVAKEHPFHPVRAYLDSLRWDGKSRLMEWTITYLGAKSSPLNMAIGQRWLISAVARIMRPGCKADHVLLLEGPQGIGKSTALEIMASPPWFTDHLSDLGSKDSRIELHGKWIIELGEFVSRRSELERKAFLTACADNFRAPYERRAQWVPRSNVFAATTNDPVPLTDETGGRRYWPVTCGQINLAQLRTDRDQIWAEAYQSYLSGEPWWDDFEAFRDALAEEQESRYQPQVWDEAILAWLENPQQRDEWVNGVCSLIEPYDTTLTQTTLADVLTHCLGKSKDKHTNLDQRIVRACLLHAKWSQSKPTKVSGTKRVVRFFTRPQPKLFENKMGEED